MINKQNKPINVYMVIKKSLISIFIVSMTIFCSFSQENKKIDYQTLSFGQNGQLKMITSE